MYNVNLIYNFAEAINKSTCDKIRMLAENNWGPSGTLAGKENVRENEVVWIKNQWVYDIIWPYMAKANNIAGWKYDIHSSEDIQISRYKEGDFYNWHRDGKGDHFSAYAGDDPNLLGRIRKLSMSILLNDDFEGGDLQFTNYSELKGDVHTPELDKTGSIIVFPSDMEHRVTPVTKGIRYSLVAWFLGPPFI
jgi:PKHD-type hydroxylase